MPERRKHKSRAPHHIWKAAFLASYRDSGNVRLSAAKAGIDRSAYYRALDTDPEFATACADAREDAVDILEARAREGATLGWEEPVIFQGEDTGIRVRRVSPSLLMFLLKGLRAAVYGDRTKLEASGPDGGPIRHEHKGDVNWDRLSLPEIEQWRALAAKAQGEESE